MSTFNRIALLQDWSDARVIQLAVEFLESHGLLHDFLDFLHAVAQDENEDHYEGERCFDCDSPICPHGRCTNQKCWDDLHVGGIRQFRIALLKDLYAEVDGKQIDLDHAWVQHAEPLKAMGLVCGDRIRCICRVGTYKKRLPVPNKDGLLQVIQYNLSFPSDIEVISRARKYEEARSEATPKEGPSVIEEASPKEDTTTPSIGNLIIEAKHLAQKAGGLDALAELIEALRQ